MNSLRGRGRSKDLLESRSGHPFAVSADHADCKRMVKGLGLAQKLAIRRLPSKYRKRIYALAGFVQMPLAWSGYREANKPSERLRALINYRNQFIRGMDGVSPSMPVLRAFCDAAREVSLPMEAPLRFLDAVERDSHTFRYETYEDLEQYFRGAAASIGLMLCDLLELPDDDVIRSSMSSLCKAIHLTLLLRDVGVETRRGRICLPVEDLKRFSGAEDGILHEKVTRTYVRLMKFEIERARALYAEANFGILLLPGPLQPVVKLVKVLNSDVLTRIEERNYDVFSRPIRTSAVSRAMTAVRLLSDRI